MAEPLMDSEPKSPTDGEVLAKKPLTKSQDQFSRAASEQVLLSKKVSGQFSH